MRFNESYDIIEINEVKPSEHSRLHHVKPKVFYRRESLTGYIKRLSQSHYLTPRRLIESEYLPLINKYYYSKGSSFYTSTARTINGCLFNAEKFSEITEALTRQSGLTKLTMLSWKGIVSRMAHGLTKTHLSWCPHCLQEMYDTDGCIYELLEWTLKVNACCYLHNVKLIDTCSSCGKKQPIFSNVKIGYCYKCQSWLGEKADENEKFDVSHIFSRENIVSKFIHEMVNRDGQLEHQPTSTDFVSSLNFYIDEVANGEVNRFANTVLGMDAKTVSQWRSMRYMPRFDMFMHICVCLHVSPIEFFQKKRLDELSINYRIYLSNRRHEELAKKCDKLKEVRFKIDEILLNNIEPPLSLEDVAKQLNVGIGYLNYNFEKESKQISGRYIKYVANKSKKWEQNIIKKVKSTVYELSRLGVRPTRYNVGGMLKSRAYFKHPIVRKAFKDAMSDIGIEV